MLGIVQITGDPPLMLGIVRTTDHTTIHGGIHGLILTINPDGLVHSVIIGVAHGIMDGV